MLFDRQNRTLGQKPDTVRDAAVKSRFDVAESAGANNNYVYIMVLSAQALPEHRRARRAERRGAQGITRPFRAPAQLSPCRGEMRCSSATDLSNYSKWRPSKNGRTSATLKSIGQRRRIGESLLVTRLVNPCRRRRQ